MLDRLAGLNEHRRIALTDRFPEGVIGSGLGTIGLRLRPNVGGVRINILALRKVPIEVFDENHKVPKDVSNAPEKERNEVGSVGRYIRQGETKYIKAGDAIIECRVVKSGEAHLIVHSKRRKGVKVLLDEKVENVVGDQSYLGFTAFDTQTFDS